MTTGTLSEEIMDRLSGLAQLHSIIDGIAPGPSMAATLHFRLIGATEGTATFEGRPDETVLNPMGTVHGGWAATVLDSALGCAVHSTLAPGERYTTLELKVNLTRAILPGMSLTATGITLTRGRRTAVAEAKLTDGGGKLFAYGSTTCLIIPAG